MATSKTQEHVFRLVFSDGIKCLFFATDNENEMNEWIRIIRKLILYISPEPKTIPIAQSTSAEGVYDDSFVSSLLILIKDKCQALFSIKVLREQDDFHSKECFRNSRSSSTIDRFLGWRQDFTAGDYFYRGLRNG